MSGNISGCLLGVFCAYVCMYSPVRCRAGLGWEHKMEKPEQGGNMHVSALSPLCPFFTFFIFVWPFSLSSQPTSKEVGRQAFSFFSFLFSLENSWDLGKIEQKRKEKNIILSILFTAGGFYLRVVEWGI